MESLDKLEIVPMDSVSISKVFHRFGVNMRYLGKITESTSMPHIRDLCIVEMIARSSKKIYRAHLADFILNEFKKSN